MAEIAEKQAHAANVVVRCADALRAKPALDDASAAALAAAARLQTFLDVLAEITREGREFKTAEVQISDNQ